MFYRENGQFKTTYRADQQIFPILQDRMAMLALLVVAFFVLPPMPGATVSGRFKVSGVTVS